ncbi:MAG: acyl-CoA thioesterase [Candidatus Kapaibacterium sp.]|nr:MAG: acyl-CoA thioesterase [Candidatus Kapabacteria bacterium]
MPLETYTREQFHHWTTVEVRWGELDAYGHVNNVVYFTYFEFSRTKFMTDLGLHDFFNGKKSLQVIVNCAMNFRREVRFPAMLEIGTRIAEIGNSSYVMHCGMFLKDSTTCAADGTGTIVCIDPATKRSMPIPEDFLEKINAQR